MTESLVKLNFWTQHDRRRSYDNGRDQPTIGSSYTRGASYYIYWLSYFTPRRVAYYIYFDFVWVYRRWNRILNFRIPHRITSHRLQVYSVLKKNSSKTNDENSLSKHLRGCQYTVCFLSLADAQHRQNAFTQSE
jgi:hypothetical protein